MIDWNMVDSNTILHPHVARNVMLKFQKKLTEFLRPQENVTPDVRRRTESWRD